MAKLCIVFLASFFVFSSNKNESRSTNSGSKTGVLILTSFSEKTKKASDKRCYMLDSTTYAYANLCITGTSTCTINDCPPLPNS
jgi:hypothetical protein